jgi:hypothetical protein
MCFQAPFPKIYLSFGYYFLLLNSVSPLHILDINSALSDVSYYFMDEFYQTLKELSPRVKTNDSL